MCQCKNPQEIRINPGEEPEVRQCQKCGHSRAEPTDLDDPNNRNEIIEAFKNYPGPKEEK